MVKTRQRIKTRRDQKKPSTRLWILGGILLVAAVAAAVLIFQQLPKNESEITTVEKQSWPSANGKALGPADAKVVVREFADFQCPYCREFHDRIQPQIISQYVSTGKIRYEYHHYIVIDGNVGGVESRRAAEASECANEQNLFWDYTHLLYQNQQTEGSGTFSNPRLKTFASLLGLDTAQFNACFDKQKLAAQVAADEKMALASQLRATPALLVNGVPVQNPLNFAQIQAAIEAALK